MSRQNLVRSIAALLLISVCAVSCSQGTEDSFDSQQETLTEVLPVGELSVHILSDSWICIVGDYYDFLLSELDRQYGGLLRSLDTGEKSVPGWSYDFYYKYRMWDIISEYRPQISSSFQDPGYFSISGADPIPLDDAHYWIAAVGQMRVPHLADEGTQDVQSAQVAHYTYLHLSRPMSSGTRYTVESRNGERTEFLYDEQESLSWMIKINQEGYLPDAGKKYGYIGMWLGDGGALDTSYLAGLPFYLVDHSSGESVFEGTLTLRNEEVQMHHLKDGTAVPIDGEIVCQMDFSSFDEPGEYHLQVPGVGVSRTFLLSEDALGHTFYTHARGLYHQRSGISKGAPYTAWEMGAGHTETYQGGFAPHDKDYRAESEEYGFFDEDGVPVRYSAFTMVADTATDDIVQGLYGGWYDAGDFDRREYHFMIVEDLLSAYLMFPQNFTDGQLQIPESGNGIPDILDEAAWGIDVWIRAQDESGGVGCWIEADSHPQVFDPAEDLQRYYLAIPTRKSSLQFSGYTALLSLAMQKAGQTERAEAYLLAAERAFSYAIDPENRAEVSFTHKEKGRRDEHYVYREAPGLDDDELFHAASLLYLATGESPYQAYCDEDRFTSALKAIVSADKVYSLMHIFLYEDFFPREYVKSYSERVLELTEDLIESQQELSYRTFNWPVDHGFFTFMAWGRGLPYWRGRALIASLRMTGEQRYRDSALLLVDWCNGANAQGRSMTTGIGEVYPVRILSLPSIADGIIDPIPGITVFTYTGAIDRKAEELVYALKVDARKDHDFTAKDISLLPDEVYDHLDEIIPIYRRYDNVEHLIVSQNEFTVWETIGPAVSFTGALLPEGWMPDDSLAMREPADSLEELAGYLPQP